MCLLNDRYVLREIIGEGSFATVWKAENVHTNEQVAIKIIDIPNERRRKKVEREIRIQGRLDHMNIVKILDYFYEFEDDCERVYIVQELADGGSLMDKIVSSPRGHLREEIAKKYFLQILDAVQYCHTNCIVHRDLKPENILLDRFGNIKINDFGLSNMITPGAKFFTFCGSLNYAAPEILQKEPYEGTATDIWSLGVMLYTMGTGQLPWKVNKGSINDINDVLFANFEFPFHVRLSEDFKDLVCRMITADTTIRASMGEVKRHSWLFEEFTIQFNIRDVPLQTESLFQVDNLIINRDDFKKRLERPKIPTEWVAGLTIEESCC